MDPELLCSENLSCVEDDTEIDETEHGAAESGEEWCYVDDEFVELMIEKETKTEKISHVNTSWVKCARSEAFTWILKTRNKLGFKLQTTYMSLMYFDRFLSKRSIDNDSEWAFRLLSIACLSLAAKMEEVKLPLLEEYDSTDYNFEAKVIQRMELLVLATLEWKMNCISPFSFCFYFRQKLCEETEQDFEYKSSARILALVREVDLMEYRPSSIAAAAILVTMDDNLTRHKIEYKMIPFIKSGLLNYDDVFKCYEKMRQLGIEDFDRKFRIVSIKASQKQLTLKNKEDIPFAETKRRRIQFSSPS